MATNDPTGPSVATIKRLFGVSGNRCAFPKCNAPLVDGEKVVGKICHIKAQNPGGPRYDPNQTAQDRHAYGNLILMCGRHADVIDADEDAYTVERLQRMKTDHERSGPMMDDADAEHGARLLFVDHSVVSTNQSGGITAHTVHVHHHAEPRSQPDELKQRAFVSEKDGAARFRAPGEPLGNLWDVMPLAQDSGREIFLAKGPALWFRMMPHDVPSREWVHDELLTCGRKGNVPLQPLSWISMQYLRAEDGVGACSAVDLLKRETETASVAFAFTTGEIWCTDTTVIQMSRGSILDFLSVARTLLPRFKGFGEFLKCLGLEPPFRWVAGLEGTKGWVLRTPPAANHASTSLGDTCLSNIVSCEGTYDAQQFAGTASLPFFRQLYRRCGVNIPAHIEELLRANRTF